MTASTPVTVGVLSLHNSKETKAICNAVEALGHEPAWLRRENTEVEVSDGEVTLRPDVDVVVNRLLLSKSTEPCEELGLARTVAQLRPTLNDPAATLTAMHKVATAAALARSDIPVPDALLALESERLNARLAATGSEAVYKTAIGTNGGGTWKVGPGERVNARVGNRYAFLQSLIERDPGERARDLRVYVVGDRVVGSMFRYAPENDWRTNVALGGEVENAGEEIPESVRDIALRATDAVGLDYAGVDLVEGEDGWLVLEVNPTAGFKGLYEATGISPAPYIAAHAVEAAGGAVADDRVAELATVLDDSVPDCRPSAAPTSAREPQSIGYIEDVIVSGTGGSETVLAKSDTGATRTSIDTGLAAEIGAGPIKSITRVKSGSRKVSKSRPVVDLVVAVGGSRHTVTASVEDRSHMQYPVLLGRDILQHYRVDVSRRADTDGEDEDNEEEEASVEE
ncbi:RimK family alpha-L-glutamate ligase [Halapricum desulfuricans]|uniref:Glutathione synthase/glutaminyl transferase/alpha-L-glutamate ligase n=1 Tax=Halapricum desulfuricans TaxID=2841257 RepID=A0A897N8H0_9EURY|nr:RimK family alpha-L-glutamate ligase [Halapricum desulfuricans]QSG07319.1 Glutathione synthase/glutaminyl transferase/alpha-L-glutamate ligase [Halapricum desulfuricans]